VHINKKNSKRYVLYSFFVKYYTLGRVPSLHTYLKNFYDPNMFMQIMRSVGYCVFVYKLSYKQIFEFLKILFKDYGFNSSYFESFRFFEWANLKKSKVSKNFELVKEGYYFDCPTP